MMAAKTTPDAVQRIHYPAAALKTPRITEAAQRLADQARDAGWTHEVYLAAVLEREVSTYNASGAQRHIRATVFFAAGSWIGLRRTPISCCLPAKIENSVGT